MNAIAEWYVFPFPIKVAKSLRHQPRLDYYYLPNMISRADAVSQKRGKRSNLNVVWVQLLYQMIYIGQILHLRLLKSNKSTLVSASPHLGLVPLCLCPIAHIWYQNHITARPAGPMARRLTTNQEIAGSIPASVNFFAFLAFYNPWIDIRHTWICIPSNCCVSAVRSECFQCIAGYLERFVFFYMP